MNYIISFLEGILVFISPCMLPMLPIYLSYFAGGDPEKRTTKSTLINVLAFIIGFTIVFVSLGAFSGFIGGFLMKHQKIVNIVSGLIIIFFGLSYIGLFQLPFFGGHGPQMNAKKLSNLNPRSSLLFGVIFSVAWTPCLTTFLAIAINLAAQTGTVLQGSLMLLCFSVGLGVPFFISAILLDQLASVFQFIKKHYGIINKIAGGFLILIGIAMMTGFFGRLLSILRPTALLGG